MQGVCWDPCGAYVASYSSDRTCRIYSTSNYRCCYNVNKITVPNSLKSGDVDQVYIFCHSSVNTAWNSRRNNGRKEEEEGKQEGGEGGGKEQKRKLR